MKVIKNSKGKTILRNKKYGVGKDILGNIYFHKAYINSFDFAEHIKTMIKRLPKNFTFNIVRFNKTNKDASFMNSPDFDSSFYPIVISSIKVNPDNSISPIRNYRNNLAIYHHRWLFVKDNYNKFSVETDFHFCKLWNRVPNLISNKYGHLNHWKNVSIPKILEFFKVKSLKELLEEKT